MVYHRKRHSNSPTTVSPRIFIVEDDHYYRDLLALQLPTLTDCTVVGSSATAADAAEQINRLKVDIVILDFMLQDRKADGLTVYQAMNGTRPEIKYILVTSANKRRMVREALHRCPQIRGMFVKTGNYLHALAEAIPPIHDGGEIYDPLFQKHLADAMRHEWEFQLTETENKLLQALARATRTPFALETLALIRQKLDLDPMTSIEAILRHAKHIKLPRLV